MSAYTLNLCIHPSHLNEMSDRVTRIERSRSENSQRILTTAMNEQDRTEMMELFARYNQIVRASS